MTPKLWFIYIAIFAAAAFIDGVGHGDLGPVGVDDINNSTGFNVDEASSGSGFNHFIRQSGGFILTTLPKFITWNFGFLNGQLDFIQYTMIFILGGLLITVRYAGDKSIIQRILP